MTLTLTTPTHIHVKGIAYLLTEVSSILGTATLMVWDSPDKVEGADRELTLYIDELSDDHILTADGSVYEDAYGEGENRWVADTHLLHPDVEIYTGGVEQALMGFGARD